MTNSAKRICEKSIIGRQLNSIMIRFDHEKISQLKGPPERLSLSRRSITRHRRAHGLPWVMTTTPTVDLVGASPQHPQHPPHPLGPFSSRGTPLLLCLRPTAREALGTWSCWCRLQRLEGHSLPENARQADGELTPSSSFITAHGPAQF